MRPPIVVVGLLIGLIAAIYFGYQNGRTKENTADLVAPPGSRENSKTSVPDAPPLAALRTPPAGYSEYRSEFYRFQLFYPEALIVKEFEEKGSARTITLKNADGSKEFQIFIVPYGDSQVTEARFKLDVPSGVRNDPVEVMIDGARATAFFSTDATLGETREVWFINKGFLYEVTTHKDLDTWLANVMSSWMFL